MHQSQTCSVRQGFLKLNVNVLLQYSHCLATQQVDALLGNIELSVIVMSKSVLDLFSQALCEGFTHLISFLYNIII